MRRLTQLLAALLVPAVAAGAVLATAARESAGPIAVADAVQLQAAVARVGPGGRIVLAPGVYGDLAIGQRSFPTPITIEAAQPGKSRIETLQLRGASNIVFKGLTFGRARRADEPVWQTLHKITDSRAIAFERATFHGSDNGDPSDDGYGLTVTGSTGVRIADSEFRDLWKGLMIVASNDVQVLRTRFMGMREDGINAAGTEDLVLDGNHFEGFQPLEKDHPDAIQLYNSNQKRGQARIRIVNNVIMQGKGRGTQGIWIADPQAFGFKDVTITNNLIQSNDMWNGIGLNGVTGAVVSGNTLISTDTDEKVMWVRLRASSGIELSNNVFETLMIQDGVTGLTQRDNVDLSKSNKRRPEGARAPRGAADLVVPGAGYQPKGDPPS